MQRRPFPPEFEGDEVFGQLADLVKQLCGRNLQPIGKLTQTHAISFNGL